MNFDGLRGRNMGGKFRFGDCATSYNGTLKRKLRIV